MAIISSLVAVALGFLGAWGFARFVLPGLGAACAASSRCRSPSATSSSAWGSRHLQLIGLPKSLLAAGIGHVVINLPLCFAIIYSQMGDHQINIERAARDLGATEWQVLGLVTVPDHVARASSPASSCP